jgi:hypothetical protein
MTSAIIRIHTIAICLTALVLLHAGSVARAANQTDTVTPVLVNSGLPYDISLQPYDRHG